MDLATDCNLPTDQINRGVKECQKSMCEKQQKIADVGVGVEKLERLSLQDKALREGWSVAESTCKKAINAIQEAIKDIVTSSDEKDRILLKVAQELDPQGRNPSEAGKDVYGNCGRLIHNRDSALSHMVMSYWKRMCSKQIKQKIENKNSDTQKARNDLRKAAKDLHALNVQFERSIEKIMTSANVNSKYVLTIEWLAGTSDDDSASLQKFEALNRAFQRGEDDADEIYTGLIQSAWDRARCGRSDDDVISVNVSKSWLYETCKRINAKAQSNCTAGRIDAHEFRFTKSSSSNKVVLDHAGGFRVKVELSITSKQEVMSVQVYKYQKGA